MGKKSRRVRETPKTKITNAQLDEKTSEIMGFAKAYPFKDDASRAPARRAADGLAERRRGRSVAPGLTFDRHRGGPAVTAAARRKDLIRRAQGSGRWLIITR